MVRSTSTPEYITSTMTRHRMRFRRTSQGVQLWVGKICLAKKLRQTPTDSGVDLDECIAEYIMI